MFGGEREPQQFADEWFWFARELLATTFWKPDLTALRAVRARVVIGLGELRRHRLPLRAKVLLHWRNPDPGFPGTMNIMGFDGETARIIRANEANWDARTPIHVASDFYSVATRDPGDWFADYEWSDLGEVEGKDVAHLQCHIGAETLAFAHRGARVVGLDISGESVEAARRLAEAAGVPARYVKSDVYAAAEALGHARFDIV